MCFGRNGSVAHCASRETRNNAAHRFHFADGHCRAHASFQMEEPAQSCKIARLIVDRSGVLLEYVVPARTRAVLQAIDGFGVEEVIFTFTTPLVLTAQFQLAMRAFFRTRWVRSTMTRCSFNCDFVEPNSAQARNSSCEEFVNKFARQSNGFEDLCSGVRSNSRHAHFRHDLQNTFARCLDVVLAGLAGIDATKTMQANAFATQNHVVNGFKSEIRVNCSRAKTNEQRHVMHFSRIAGFHNETNKRALFLTNEMVMNSTCHEE